MALQTEEAEILTSWNALRDSQDRDEGWRSIALQGSRNRIRAGILFPGRNEAVLAGFAVDKSGGQSDLPVGRGFSVSAVSSPDLDGSLRWYSLSRRDGADETLFLKMAADVLSVVTSYVDVSEQVLLGRFLQRVREWQRFMGRSSGLMDHESEIGLHGELIVLDEFLEAGCAPIRAISSWLGPEGALHDIIFGSLAVEVKATTARSGFPVTISSLEQLDSSLGLSIVLAGVRLCAQSDGFTLSDRIAQMRTRIAGDPEAATLFEGRLVTIKYFDADSENYFERYALTQRRNFEIGATFPRLARSLLPPAIRAAEYVIDLDMVAAGPFDSKALFDLAGISGP